MTKEGNNGQVLLETLPPVLMKVVAEQSKMRGGLELSCPIVRVLTQGRVVEVFEEAVDSKGNQRVKISVDPEGWLTKEGNNGQVLLEPTAADAQGGGGAAGASGVAGLGGLSADDTNDLVGDFMSEVKEIEERDKDMTGPLQIDRLLQPGSKYFNLNPFEVLRIIPPRWIEEEAKKSYKVCLSLFLFSVCPQLIHRHKRRCPSLCTRTRTSTTATGPRRRSTA